MFRNFAAASRMKRLSKPKLHELKNENNTQIPAMTAPVFHPGKAPVPAWTIAIIAMVAIIALPPLPVIV